LPVASKKPLTLVLLGVSPPCPVELKNAVLKKSPANCALGLKLPL
jgi:hypothetical protein